MVIFYKLLFSNNLNNKSLDILNLSNGVYLLKVNVDNGSLVKKIVIE